MLCGWLAYVCSYSYVYRIAGKFGGDNVCESGWIKILAKEVW